MEFHLNVEHIKCEHDSSPHHNLGAGLGLVNVFFSFPPGNKFKRERAFAFNTLAPINCSDT